MILIYKKNEEMKNGSHGAIYRHANTCCMMTQLAGFREGRLVLIRWLPFSFSLDYIMLCVTFQRLCLYNEFYCGCLKPTIPSIQLKSRVHGCMLLPSLITASKVLTVDNLPLSQDISTRWLWLGWWLICVHNQKRKKNNRKQKLARPRFFPPT